MIISNFKFIKENGDGSSTYEYSYSNLTKRDKEMLRKKYKCKRVTKNIINKFVYDAICSYIKEKEVKK